MARTESDSRAESVVTIGNFDGVHRGHQKIIELTCDIASRLGLQSVAFTFRPHPQSVLRPDRAPGLLLTYDEKREILLSYGLQEVIEQPFDVGFAATTPELFFDQVLRSRLRARAVVVGYDFTFGKERAGHLQVLEHLCNRAGIELTVVPPHRVESEVVSSSVIRQALSLGRVAEAALGLGRSFFYRGTVVRGDQRGRSLGFPTANFPIEATRGGKMVIPLGVYATRLVVGGVARAAITNLGIRPTFGALSSPGAPILVETHVLDQVVDLYGQEIQVEFIDRIREEVKFASVDELKAAIDSDIRKARQILG